MTPDLSIKVSWLPGTHGPDEIRLTSAFLEIAIRGKIATRVEDEWSQSVQRGVRLSAYPLALWFASSWWRLRWEPSPWIPNTSWSMAHITAAAGHGYLWPHLTFESDGESVEAVCRASSPSSAEPVRYLASFRETIEALNFERAIDDFTRLVLARLDAVGVSGTELERLWNEVLEERGDARMAEWRRLEAQLGFEPDEAPAELLQRLVDLSLATGSAAVSEIAPTCAGPEPDRVLRNIVEFSKSQGTEAFVPVPHPLMNPQEIGEYSAWAPGKRGWLLASRARQAWGLGAQPLPDIQMADLLSISADSLGGGGPSAVRLPLGLAVRHEGADRMKLLFHKRNRPGLRFEAARFVADHILNPPEERWLPATDMKTARQKVQRAFAAEFLCPIATLEDFLDADLSPEAIEEAAEYFGVSELAVKSHLANHGRIPFEAVTV